MITQFCWRSIPLDGADCNGMYALYAGPFYAGCIIRAPDGGWSAIIGGDVSEGGRLSSHATRKAAQAALESTIAATILAS